MYRQELNSSHPTKFSSQTIDNQLRLVSGTIHCCCLTSAHERNRVCFRRDVVQCLSCDNLKYKRATKGKCAVLFINSSNKNANQIPDFAAIDVRRLFMT